MRGKTPGAVGCTSTNSFQGLTRRPCDPTRWRSCRINSRIRLAESPSGRGGDCNQKINNAFPNTGGSILSCLTPFFFHGNPPNPSATTTLLCSPSAQQTGGSVQRAVKSKFCFSRLKALVSALASVSITPTPSPLGVELIKDFAVCDRTSPGSASRAENKEIKESPLSAPDLQLSGG